MSVKEQELQGHLEKKEYWWWAEKSRSERVNYLRKAVWSKATKGSSWLPGIKMCLEQPKQFTKVFKEALPSEPYIITRAKAVAATLDNMPVFIIDHSLLVGYYGSAPHKVGWPIHVSTFQNEDTMNDRGGIVDEEERPMVKEMVGWWKGRTYQEYCEKYFTRQERIQNALSTTILANRHLGGFDYFTPQNRWLYKLGFSGILKQVEDNLAMAMKKVHEELVDAQDQITWLPKINTWNAMKICLEAMMRRTMRYSRLARIIAENFETDIQRKQELLQMSENLRKISTEGPETLWQAMQFDHLIQTYYRVDWPNSVWSCRPDYYLYPFYKKDVIENKTMSREMVLDLTCEYMIRCFETGRQMFRIAREAMQGDPGPFVWTLGGVYEDGSDACNDMTDMFLEAARLVRVASPTFNFRYHPKCRIQTMRNVFECIRHGLGYPSMRHDDVLIANLMNWFKFPLEEARTWINQACMAPAPDTKWGCQAHRHPMASLVGGAVPVVLAVHNGFDPVSKMQLGPKTGDAANFKTFDEFYNAWLEQYKFCFYMATRCEHICRYVSAFEFQRPLWSSLYERCVETGINVDEIKEVSTPWYTLFAPGDTWDSLAAVKKLVFEDKKYTMKQLVEALKANWEGYEEMRMEFVKAPKWGNDDDYVDEIWVRAHADIRDVSWSAKNWSGQPWPALPESIAWFSTHSTRVGATPNGRRWGDTLYDGGCSPGAGQDKKGPTAVLRSVAKLDHVGMFRATLLNQRLNPTQMAGEKGFDLWMNYMKTWYDLKINHVQFNCVDNETLRAAQKEPEKYTELMVRIAGYSAAFVEMNRKTQDVIIARTVQML